MVTGPCAGRRSSSLPGLRTFTATACRLALLSPTLAGLRAVAAPPGDIPPGPRSDLLVDRLCLIVARHHSRQIDRSREIRPALYRARLARHRILEYGSLEDKFTRILPAGYLGHRPPDRETHVVIAGRDREQFEVRDCPSGCRSRNTRASFRRTWRARGSTD